MTADWDAVVVGAGVGGLVAARDLARRGLRTLVLEARPAAGGAVARHTVGGLTLDAGAESFATRGGAVVALAEDLGMGSQIVAPEPLGSWATGPWGAGPLPRAGVLGIPADPWAADVRATIGLLGSLRAGADRWLPAAWGSQATTLGALVRARYGRRVLDRLVRPVVGGVHATDPDLVAADAVAPGLRGLLAERGSLGAAVAAQRELAPAGAAVLGFVGGLHVLVDTLLADLTGAGVPVRTRSAVTALGRAAAPDRADGAGDADGVPAGRPPFEVRVGDERLTTDRLVVAAPTGLLSGVAPGLDAARTDPGARVTLVTLVLDAPALDDAPRGTGVLVAPGTPDVRAKALTHATAKWAWLAGAAGHGRHVLRLSYGGDGSLAEDALPVHVDPDDAVRTALADAARLLGTRLGPAQLVDRAVVRWSQALPSPSAERRAAVQRVQDGVAQVPGLAVTGAWVAGNGLASVVPDALRAASQADCGVID